MEEKELISIIAAVYNVAPYLRGCLDSVLAQTYSRLEVILVDDGSDDGSAAICDEYAERDVRVTVVHQFNQGPSAARNTGLQYAHGEIISFVDADDRLHPRFCQLLYARMEETGADIAVGNYDFIHRIDEEKPEEIRENTVFTKTGYEAQFLFYNSAWCIQNGVVWLKLYRRRCLASLRFPEGRIHEDTYMMPMLFDQAEKVVYTDAVLYYYLVRPDSITGAYYKKRLDQLDAQEHVLRFYRERGYEALYTKACESYLHSIRNHYFDVRRYLPEEKALPGTLDQRFRRAYRQVRGPGLSRAAKLEFDLFCLNKRLYQIVWKLWLKVKK